MTFHICAAFYDYDYDNDKAGVGKEIVTKLMSVKRQELLTLSEPPEFTNFNGMRIVRSFCIIRVCAVCLDPSCSCSRDSRVC